VNLLLELGSYLGSLSERIEIARIARELLAWIAKSRLKQGKYPLEIARFGNLAEPKGNFSGFSDSLLGRRQSGNFSFLHCIQQPVRDLLFGRETPAANHPFVDDQGG
jgi:hypothetical protein